MFHVKHSKSKYVIWFVFSRDYLRETRPKPPPLPPRPPDRPARSPIPLIPLPDSLVWTLNHRVRDRGQSRRDLAPWAPDTGHRTGGTRSRLVSKLTIVDHPDTGRVRGRVRGQVRGQVRNRFPNHGPWAPRRCTIYRANGAAAGAGLTANDY